MYSVCTGTSFAQELIYAFSKRRDKIMENDAMKNALYCDPRYLFILTKEERRQARIRLMILYKRIISKEELFSAVFP